MTIRKRARMVPSPPRVKAALAFAGAADAAFAVYTFSAGLAVAVGTSDTDTYDSLPVTSVQSSLTRSAGGFQYTVGATGDLYGAGIPSDTWPLTAVSGQTIIVNAFPATARTIGSQFIGWDDQGAFLASHRVTVTATDALGAVEARTVANPTPTSFLAFVSTVRLASPRLRVDAAAADLGAFGALRMHRLPPADGRFLFTERPLHRPPRIP